MTLALEMRVRVKMQKTICTDQKQSSKGRPPENRGKKGRNKEEGEGGVDEETSAGRR